MFIIRYHDDFKKITNDNLEALTSLEYVSTLKLINFSDFNDAPLGCTVFDNTIDVKNNPTAIKGGILFQHQMKIASFYIVHQLVTFYNGETYTRIRWYDTWMNWMNLNL